MFITMPIKNFKLDGNKVKVNESVIEYEPVSEDDREILESLISKGAYGSALLTLNTKYNVKSINESKYTHKDYISYLNECNNLMKECVSETKAHNFRPLINLNGLEIMESDTQIARGKGDKLLIEDFRDKTALKEQDITMSSNSEDGWGEDVEDLTTDFFDYVDRVAYEIKNARRGSYADIGTSIEDLASTFDNISAMASELSSIFSNAEVNYSDDEEDYDEDLDEGCEGTQCSDIAGKKDQEVGSLQKPSKPKKHFTEMFNVPRNHGFKGFRLNENGYYTRGNYVLINENGNIRAVNKNKLTENMNIDLLYKTLHLDQDLEEAMIKGASKVLYIEEDEVKDYCSIEFEEDEDNNDYVRVYFLAEVSYEEGTRIVDEYLDRVITKYDKDAYFEAETTGRWVALVRKEYLN